MRTRATFRVRLLRRILRRLVVLVGHLQVVLRRDRLRVAHPFTDHVDRELFGEFSLARAPQVVEQLGPGIDTSTADDPQELSPQVGICVTVAGDHVDAVGRAVLVVGGPHCVELFTQLGEQRDDPRGFTLVVGSLRARHTQQALLPVDVVPGEGQVLTRAP
ncbi:hypothetical protein NG895_06970 [Aeoliella sp. ICT_H6.2]|uniref:Uncharacterized protein n=1 Tax=Aeoliella straminimaris TaxID=2954799 RepID=A0A9X2F881_9BACT|nr:hypothetical protein [Aeoliella straminimaris]MCO6043644.1 hypothetical protein [Aeoliella straminimaris]